MSLVRTGPINAMTRLRTNVRSPDNATAGSCVCGRHYSRAVEYVWIGRRGSRTARKWRRDWGGRATMAAGAHKRAQVKPRREHYTLASSAMPWDGRSCRISKGGILYEVTFDLDLD